MRGWKAAGATVGLTAILVGGVMAGPAGPVAADAGDLDPSFGTGGTATTDPLGVGDNDRTSTIAVQADGKIVISTDLTGNGTFSGPLVRYNADGSLDDTLGAGGVARTDSGGCVFCGADMALQSDGKIVVAGAGVLSFALFWTPTVARFNPDGTADASFGTGGLATPSPPLLAGRRRRRRRAARWQDPDVDIGCTDRLAVQPGRQPRHLLGRRWTGQRRGRSVSERTRVCHRLGRPAGRWGGGRGQGHDQR